MPAGCNGQQRNWSDSKHAVANPGSIRLIIVSTAPCTALAGITNPDLMTLLLEVVGVSGQQIGELATKESSSQVVLEESVGCL
ncbi:MAG: hypothetical protein O2856_07575, partial [Planctomycetota bacterium]|nr:hypothetical protein [Planctomycetota bacterium]